MLKKLVRPAASVAIAVAAGMLVPDVSGGFAGLLDVSGGFAGLPDLSRLFGSTPATVELVLAGQPTELGRAYRLRVAELPEPPADVTYAAGVGGAPIMAPLGCPFEVRAVIAGGGDAFAIVAEARVGVGASDDPGLGDNGDTTDTRLVRAGDSITTARGRATITAITPSAVKLTLNAAAIRCDFKTR